VWNSQSGHFKCSETWEKLREVHPVVKWWKIVWSATTIHSHSFFLSLVFRDALQGSLCVYSVMKLKRAVVTFSLGAVSVNGFGLESWLITLFAMCLWIGKI
jgi:hypothetical protein